MVKAALWKFNTASAFSNFPLTLTAIWTLSSSGVVVALAVVAVAGVAAAVAAATAVPVVAKEMASTMMATN
jgi:hypothetical protein